MQAQPKVLGIAAAAYCAASAEETPANGYELKRPSTYVYERACVVVHTHTQSTAGVCGWVWLRQGITFIR